MPTRTRWYRRACGSCGKPQAMQRHLYNQKMKQSASGKVFCSKRCVGIFNSAKVRVRRACRACGKDALQDRVLRAAGWRVYRIAEADATNGQKLDGILDAILEDILGAA